MNATQTASSRAEPNSRLWQTPDSDGSVLVTFAVAAAVPAAMLAAANPVAAVSILTGLVVGFVAG